MSRTIRGTFRSEEKRYENFFNCSNVLTLIQVKLFSKLFCENPGEWDRDKDRTCPRIGQNTCQCSRVY